MDVVKLLAAGIAQLEAEKTKLLNRMDEDSDQSLIDHLATANNRIAKYEVQLNARTERDPICHRAIVREF